MASPSIEIPEDPLDIGARFIKRAAHRIALHLMDETRIMSARMSDQPNEIESLGISYEKLPSDMQRDASARRWVARQLSLLRKSTYKRYPFLALTSPRQR